MTITVKVNIPKISNEILWSIIWAVNKWLEELKEWVDEKTPEDTKTLLWNNQITQADIVWNTVMWKVFNDTEYAYKVEYWMPRAVNYHKPKWTVFFKSWQYKWLAGARMFTRTKDEMEQKIVNDIKKSIW